MKKTKGFTELTGALTEKMDRMVDPGTAKVLEEKATAFAPYLSFVLRHENLLRRIAGDRAQFVWLHKYLDWLKKNDATE